MIERRISAAAPAPLTRISYWLMPIAEESDCLGELIRRLAETFKGPVFAPHLTLYSGPRAANDDAALIIEKTAGRNGGLILRCTGLEFSERFTKSCFLTFASKPRLPGLSETLRRSSGCPERYDLKPHLSLFYGKLSGFERQRIREMVELPDTVRFDAMTAMATSASIQNDRDVMSWRTLASRKF